MKLLLLALAAAASAAMPRDNKEKMSLDTSLLTPPPVQWIKIYPLSPYKEHWSLDLEVKDYEKDTQKIVTLFEKAGATLTQPLDLFPTSRTERNRQVSFRGSLKSAQAALKKLGKAATILEMRQRPAAEPVSLAEVNGKIEKLVADRKAHEAELARMPAVSVVVEELLGHLLNVRAVQERTDSEVLINISIKEKK